MAELEISTGFLHTQGAEIYYEVAGEGEPLLLIHAGVADSRMWDDQFSVFAQEYRVIRYDIRGFGRSVYPHGPFAHHEDPAALLKHLGITKAHVLGVSFGGRTAIDFTLAHPELVSSLVLVAPGVSGGEPAEDMIAYWTEEDRLLESGDLEGAAEITVHTWVDGPKRTPEQLDPAIRRRVHDMQYLAYTLPVPEDMSVLELDPPAKQRLHEIHVPTLIIVGDYDLASVQERTAYLSHEIAGAEAIIIPQTAHMLNMEKPAEFNQAVLAFLRKQ